MKFELFIFFLLASPLLWIIFKLTFLRNTKNHCRHCADKLQEYEVTLCNSCRRHFDAEYEKEDLYTDWILHCIIVNNGGYQDKNGKVIESESRKEYLRKYA